MFKHVTTLVEQHSQGWIFNVAATDAGKMETLSVGGCSPIGNLHFQVGSDSDMEVDFSISDVELTDLGISNQHIRDMGSASDAIAAISTAVDRVANNRALVGAQVSRLNHIYQGNASYGDNMAQAEARIRDVDFARETAELAAAQVGTQAAEAMLQQANLTTQIVMQLLQ